MGLLGMRVSEDGIGLDCIPFVVEERDLNPVNVVVAARSLDRALTRRDVVTARRSMIEKLNAAKVVASKRRFLDGKTMVLKTITRVLDITIFQSIAWAGC